MGVRSHFPPQEFIFSLHHACLAVHKKTSWMSFTSCTPTYVQPNLFEGGSLFLFLAGHLPPISQIERKKKKNPFSLESKLLVQDGMEEEMGSLSAVKKMGPGGKMRFFLSDEKFQKTGKGAFSISGKSLTVLQIFFSRPTDHFHLHCHSSFFLLGFEK